MKVLLSGLSWNADDDGWSDKRLPPQWPERLQVQPTFPSLPLRFLYGIQDQGNYKQNQERHSTSHTQRCRKILEEVTRQTDSKHRFSEVHQRTGQEILVPSTPVHLHLLEYQRKGVPTGYFDQEDILR